VNTSFLQAAKQRLVPNPRLAAAYTYGYNLPLFATRAQQLGLSIRWLLREYPDRQLIIRGRGSEAALAAAGLYCAQATDLDEQALSRVQLELTPGSFSFAQVADIRDPDFLPGSARYFDVPGLLAALRGTRITLHAENRKSTRSSSAFINFATIALADVFGDLHRAVLGAAHAAEVGALEGVLRQRLVVVGAGVSGSSDRRNCSFQSKANRALLSASSRSARRGGAGDVGGVGGDLVGDHALLDVFRCWATPRCSLGVT
jgi:hypothetical protein